MRSLIIAFALLLAGTMSAGAAETKTDAAKAGDAKVCGGIAGTKCGETEWCDYPATNACGIADVTGICKARPGACTQDVKPVCGCDDKDYSNACWAEMEGHDVKHVGMCGTK